MVPPAQLAAMWVMVPPDIDMAASSGDITAREHSDTAQLVCAAQGVPQVARPAPPTTYHPTLGLVIIHNIHNIHSSQPKIVWRREGGQKIR